MPTMRRTLSILALALLLSPPAVEAQSDTATSAATRELAEMQRAITAVMQKQPVDFAAYSALAEKNRARVAELIARDELRTASDFLGASMLAGEPSGFYESRRVEHELAMTALALGHPAAMKRVALTWDALNWSLGRGQRIGTMMRNGIANNMDPVPAPAVIRDVFKDLPAVRQRAQGKSNNAELERMRNEDQADREGPMDRAKMDRMTANDSVRLARTLRLLAEAVPATGRDFGNAATVLQHGHTPDDYRLAHELSIAAVAL